MYKADIYSRTTYKLQSKRFNAQKTSNIIDKNNLLTYKRYETHCIEWVYTVYALYPNKMSFIFSKSLGSRDKYFEFHLTVRFMVIIMLMIIWL